MKKLQEFRKKLEEIFEIDKAELDFGIYRIINQKRTEINKFLNTLENDVKEELKSIGSLNIEDKRKELADKIKQIEDLGYNPDENPQIKKMKEELNSSLDITSIESEIYSHLTNFFSRYYSEGDFISQRRYKEGVYALPYEGEEVKLHWANHDQYYIKTSENFKNYVVKLDENKKLIFQIVEASSEKNNNKESSEKERRFFLTEENPIEIKENEIIVKFEYNPSKEKQDKLNENADKTVLEYLKENNLELFDILAKEQTSLKKKPSKLLRELNNYTAKNSFDYFIHKDLGGFLRRELDFYIKNEVMFLDDLDEDRIKNSIAKVKAIKKIGNKIIQMLEQLENFQKKLWEKKKFVTETNYCFTIDKIFEKFEEDEQKNIFEEILSNEEQVREWKEMYDFDIVEAEKKAKEKLATDEHRLTQILKENNKLVIDTKYFSNEFKEKIIAGFDNLDEELNGLLIHSENFQALNLLQEKYREKVKCVYIDPPYNTNASKIIYKNGYEHSTWISLLHDRLNLSKYIMNEKSIIEVAIDDYEMRYLNIIMDIVFGINNSISNIALLTNPKGRDQGFIAQAHDYTLMYAKDKKTAETNSFILTEEEMSKKFSKLKDGVSVRELPLKRTGSGKFREDRPYMFFPFIFNRETNDLSVIKEEEYKKIYNPETKIFDDKFLENIKTSYEKQGFVFILPISDKNEYLRWRWGYSSAIKGIKTEELFVKETKKGNYAVYQYDTGDNEATPKSLWFDERYDASTKGTNLLNDIIPTNPFDYPKSIFTVEDNLIIGANQDSIIIDYFAGSGTTGHAVIELNREDNKKETGSGNRKYILVEMGEYFETVTKPRIKKVIYSKDWKNGKPISREGISQIFKYIKLEQYEDTLNNLMINQPKSLFNTDKNFQEDYMLNYMMNFETKDSPSLLNIDMFDNPFGYKMKIFENNEMKSKNIDLVETSNFLIGLEIDRIEKTRYFDYLDNKLKENISKEEFTYCIKEVTGKTREGEKVLVIWRNRTKDKALDNIVIEEFFRKQRYNTLDMEFDRIYINGDNTLQNIRKDGEHWKVELIEEKFKKMMFEEKTL